MPASARITTVFLTNGCTDLGASGRIVEEFMGNFGVAATKFSVGPDGLFPEGLPDPGLDETYQVVDYGNSRMIHLNTTLGDKPNALNIVDTLARGKDPVVINVDVDSFVEPDAVPRLYGRAYDEFVRNPGDTLVLYGRPMKVEHPDGYDLEVGPDASEDASKIIRDIIPTFENSAIKVKGYFHAWSPEVMARVGGVPRVEPDDWVNDLVALREGMKTVEVEDARVWITPSRTLGARKDVMVRRFRGIRGIMAEYPDLSELAEQEFMFMRPPEARHEMIVSWLERDHIAPDALPYIEKLWDDIIEEGGRDVDSPAWARIEGSR